MTAAATQFKRPLGWGDRMVARIWTGHFTETGCRVTFEIVEYEEMVRLTVTHDELEAGSGMANGVKQGWPAVLSSLAVQDDLDHRRLGQVAVADVDLARALRAVWPTGQRPTGPARDLLAIAARAHPAGLP